MTPSNPSVNCSELAASLTNLAKSIAKRERYSTYDQVVDHIQREFPEVSRKELSDSVLSARESARSGKKKSAQARLESILREAEGEGRVQRLIEKVQEQIKTGKFDGDNARDLKQANQTLKLLRKESNRLKAEAGLKRDIQEMRESGKPVEAKPKSDQHRDDPQIQSLREIRSRLVKKLGEPDRIQARVNELNTQIEDARAGRVPEPKPMPEKNERVAALESERDSLYRQARKPKDAIEGRIKDLEKQIKEAKAGKVPDPIRQGEKDARVKALESERDKLFGEAREPRRIQQRIKELTAQIDEANAGVLPESKQQKEKVARIKQLEQMRDAARKTTREPARVEARAKQLEAEIEKVRKGDLPQSKPQPEKNEQIKALEKERDLLVNQARKIKTLDEQIATYESGKRVERGKRIDAPVSREVADKMETRNKLKRKADLADQIDELTTALETDKMPVQKSKTARISDDETLRLEIRRDELAGKVKSRIEDLKPKSIFGKTVGRTSAAQSFLRAIQTSFDISAPGRQGATLVAAHPILAGKAFASQIRALLSETAAQSMKNQIEGSKHYLLAKRAKLDFADWGGGPSAREEYFMSRAAEKIPGVQASGRAYTTFLNKLRYDTFESLVESKGGNVSAEEAKSLANYINVATGRGNAGKFASTARDLGAVFYAPRNTLSRFQYLLGQPLGTASAGTRAVIAREYAKTLAGFGVVTALGIAAGGKVSTDPNSADFGKLRFGDTRIDFGAGLLQPLVFLSRLISGKATNAKGETKPISPMDLTGQFARSKLAPLLSAAVDLKTGKDVVGNEVTPTSELLKEILPLAIQDTVEALQSQGIPKGVALGLLAMLGIGVQNYENN